MTTINGTQSVAVEVTDAILFEAIEYRVYEEMNKKFHTGVRPRDRGDRLVNAEDILGDKPWRVVRKIDYGHHRGGEQEEDLPDEAASWIYPRLEMLKLLRETLNVPKH